MNKKYAVKLTNMQSHRIIATNRNRLARHTLATITNVYKLVHKHDRFIVKQIEAEKFGEEFQRFVDTTNDVRDPKQIKIK